VNFPFLVKFELSPTWRRFSPSAHNPRAELAFPRVRGPYPARALKICFSRGLSQLLFYYFGDGCGGQAHCWSILTLGSPGKFPGLTRIWKKDARLFCACCTPRSNSHLEKRRARARLTRYFAQDAGKERCLAAPARIPPATLANKTLLPVGSLASFRPDSSGCFSGGCNVSPENRACRPMADRWKNGPSVGPDRWVPN